MIQRIVQLPHFIPYSATKGTDDQQTHTHTYMHRLTRRHVCRHKEQLLIIEVKLTRLEQLHVY